ncbi:MAG: FGGY-family carbohydrate kinase [Bacteroidota bacterium]
MALLAIDFGTTNCKAGVFAQDGRQLAVATQRTPSHQDQWGTVWYAEEVWETVRVLVRQVVAEATSEEGSIEGISTSSVGESGVLLDAAGRPLYPIIAWYDTRTLAERDFWATHFGEQELRCLTGLPLDPIYSINKLMWMRTHAPEAVEGARRFLLMADWLAFKLSGEQVTNYSLASRTMSFDLAHRRFAEEILDLAGLPQDIFGEAVPSGTVIGGLLPEMAEELDLIQGIPVVAGGQDHVVASLGAGLASPGRLLNSTGTAETALAIVQGDLSSMAAPGVTLGCHVVNDFVYAMTTMRASGASTEWALREFADLGQNRPSSGGQPAPGYETLLRLLEKGQAADKGLFFFPLLRGSLVPDNHPEATGAFLGLRDTHTRADLARAVFEGVCLEAAYEVDYLRQVTGVGLDRAIAVGGATKNPLWMQIKADVYGLPVDVPVVQEAALLGAAMLAGLGVGLYRNVAEAVVRTTQGAVTYAPDPERRAFWVSAQERYNSMRQTLLQLAG